MRCEIRVDPVDLQALLVIKFMARVLVENQFGDQAIYGHDGQLSVDLCPTVHEAHILSRSNLTRFMGKREIVLKTPSGILRILGNALHCLVGAWDENLLPIHVAQISEVAFICEGVLRQDEEWAAFTVRSAPQGRTESPHFGSAKIDAA